MKEKIEQLSKGEFKYELPKILLSVEELNITVDSGSTFEGSFTIGNSSRTRMKGLLYSSSRFLRLNTDRFVGEENTISYHVLGEQMESGQQIDSSLHIITDCGEVVLPVQIKVEEPSCASSVGRIKDMFQFTNLARSDWSEAKQLFKSEYFDKIINYYDSKHSLIYQGLRKSSGISQAMEEFLISIRKKVLVKLTVDKTNFSYEAIKYSFMDKIVLTKEGWGYAQIRITTDAPFIELDRRLIWADNFIGNTYNLNFVVKAEGMKDGIHTGNIYITTVYQTISIMVTIHCERDRVKERRVIKKQKQYELKLIQNYLQFRFNQLDVNRYVGEAETLLEGLSGFSKNTLFLKLYGAHVKMIANKEVEAKKYLDSLEDLKAKGNSFSATEQGLMLYLKTLIFKETVNITETVEEIRQLYAKNPGEWMLFWCLLYLDKSYERDKRKKFEDIKKVFMAGCKSPILYYEAVFLLNEEPTLLRSLDRFELNMISFGLKWQFFSKELAAQVTYLAARGKENGRLLLYILKLIYEKYKQKEALIAICTILIRSHRMNAYAFQWYQLGILEQLRITELPEYYLYSMEDELYEELNHSVLTYFTYNSKLPDKKKAYLYANIISHKDSNQEIYHQYEKQIYDFALQKLESKSISRDLGVIYDEVLHQVELNPKLAELIPEVAFYYLLECKNPNMKSVLVMHKEHKVEKITPIIEGKALIELYTENSEIFLMDERQERYHVTIDYTIFKLTHLEDLLTECYKFCQTNEKLLLHLSDKVHTYQKFDATSITLRKQVTQLKDIQDELRVDYFENLIYYYYDNFQGEILDNLLMQIDVSNFSSESRKRIIEIMIQRDLYEPAIHGMREFGYEEIDVKKLLKLCSRVIMNDGGEAKRIDIIVDICSFVFVHGKYNETVLNYLVSNYYGTTKEMFELWRTAKNFDVDTTELEDRLLAQMLFAESYLSFAVPVFMSYYRSGYNRKLIRAFLSYYSYKYLVRDRIPEPELFDLIKREAQYERNDICLLALLKYYSKKELLTDSEINFIEYHMKEFEQKNIVLPFFRAFRWNMRIPECLYDKYYVEYYTDSKNKVVIYYNLDTASEAGNYVAEQMVHVCYGIFVKEFVLFNNETLQYYISEESEENVNITESLSVRLPKEESETEESKYQQLNLILEAVDGKDETTIEKLLEQYVRADYAISKLFKPV